MADSLDPHDDDLTAPPSRGDGLRPSVGEVTPSQAGTPRTTPTQPATPAMSFDDAPLGGEVPMEFGEEICPLEPGARCGGRYRILEKVGAGGMGEVWRARDEALQQLVALKFLGGPYLEKQEEGLTLLRNEVRLARQVSHPNVCRVHDIGEVGGKTFLSMEFIDGETLARTLTRLGRPSPEKSLKIARQLVAGLNAAHEQGVLHRDLKPSNVMIDGRGDVQLTDFGIAGGVADDDQGGTPGTFGYMAPELFSGSRPDVQTDLYALGVVLYELFTGRRLFQASSMTELMQKHRAPIEPPSLHISDIDPEIEAIILDCLQREPEDRPRSALEILSRLSGSDFLSEIVRSGHTPSPELVAASGHSEKNCSKKTILLCAAFFLSLLGLFLLEPQVKLVSTADLPWSGDVLRSDAERSLEQLGIDPRELRGSASGFDINSPYLTWLYYGKTGPDRFAVLTEKDPMTPPLDFWYRASPQALVAEHLSGVVTWSDPPPVDAGMVRMRLSPDGGLLEFERVPAELAVLEDDMVAPEGATGPETDAARLEASIQTIFEVSQLDRDAFVEAEPKVVPTAYADVRKAWRRTADGLRLEAAFLHGKLVSSRLFGEEMASTAAYAPKRDRPPTSGPMKLFRLFFSIAAAILAYRVLRQGRGDRLGAFRVGLGVFGIVFLVTLLTGSHSADLAIEGRFLLRCMARALLVAVQYAMFYLALESHVRRIWPEMLVSWTRLLRGRFSDREVSYNVLVGLAFGAAAAFIQFVARASNAWLGMDQAPPLIPRQRTIEVMRGGADALGSLLEIVVSWADVGMAVVIGLVLFKFLTRSKRAAFVAMTVVLMALWGTNLPGFHWVSALAIVVVSAAAVTVAVRVGMLALLVALCVYQLFTVFPLKTDLTHWLGEATVFVVLLTSFVVLLTTWQVIRPKRAPALLARSAHA